MGRVALDDMFTFNFSENSMSPAAGFEAFAAGTADESENCNDETSPQREREFVGLGANRILDGFHKANFR